MKVRLAVLLAWCGLMFGYGLTGNLFRTEGLRAVIAQETLADGRWLVPHLYGKPFVTKPPGMYVAIAVCSAPFGRVTDWAARIPSLFFLTLTLVFVFLHFRRLLGESKAFWIAMFMPVSFLWLEKCPSAEIDPLQLAWVTWSLLTFHRAYLAEIDGRTRAAAGWWFLSLTCVAGGILTKWTAPAFYYLTVIAFVAVNRQWTMLFRWRHLAAGLFCVGLVATWAVLAADSVGWSTLRETIGAEAAQRFAPDRTNKKPYPWGETFAYPFVLLAANSLASVAVLLSLRKSFRDRLSPTEKSAYLLGHCWIWPSLVFWTLPAQHNVRYVLPMIPGFSLIAALWWVKWFEARPAQPWRRAAFVAPLALWLVVKVVYTEVVHPNRLAERDARGIGTQLAALVPPGEPLTIAKMKDEGAMFYYGRPVEQEKWPAVGSPPKFRWAFLMPDEWARVEALPGVRMVAQLREQDGRPAYLVVDDSP